MAVAPLVFYSRHKMEVSGKVYFTPLGQMLDGHQKPAWILRGKPLAPARN